MTVKEQYHNSHQADRSNRYIMNNWITSGNIYVIETCKTGMIPFLRQLLRYTPNTCQKYKKHSMENGMMVINPTEYNKDTKDYNDICLLLND